jgi:hypothetical protein
MARVWIVLMLCCVLFSQQKPPAFEDFSSRKIFTGTPVPPQLIEPWAKMYHTRISDGVAKPDGAFRGFEYVASKGPNFAGHYFVINWGCGSGCLMLVVVDALTGHVYPPPLSVGDAGNQKIGIPKLGTGWADFDYRPNSRLFMMKTCPADGGSAYPFSGTSYFTMEPEGWRLIRRFKCEASN